MDVFSAQQAFALNLYNTFALANEGKNFLMSPLSIFAALSLVLPGAREGTLQQMLRAMRLNSSAPLESTEEALGKMLAAAAGPGGSAAQLLLANRAFIETSYAVRQEFTAAIRTYFGAEFGKADFAKDPEAERKRINDWVAAVTHGKIDKLLTPNVVQKQTRLMLVNALYFKANWNVPFDPENTFNEPFETRERRSAISVPMMHRTDEFPLIRIRNQLTGVRFDFKPEANSPAPRTALFAFLPAERHRLDALLSGLTAEDWLRVVNTPATTRKALVALPKVRLSGRAELSEPRFLPSLGISDLFRRANLSGMGPGDLVVSTFTHQAVLELDEFGAEGAAASSVEVSERSLPSEIKFDQPFLLVIAREAAGPGTAGAPRLVPIFMGRVSDPSQA